MKKLIFTLFVSIIGINFVLADDSNVAHFNYFYNHYSDNVNLVNNYSTQIEYMKNYFNNNLSNDYSYYVINYVPDANVNHYSYLTLYLTSDNIFSTNGTYINYHYINYGQGYVSFIRYIPELDTYYYNINSCSDFCSSNTHGTMPIETNVDFVFYSSQYDEIIIPSFSDTNLDVSFPQYQLYHGDILPTFMTLSNNSYDTYTEINVNAYSYVILSLRNYEQSSFNTNIYTFGRLCLTPVYNYGMTPRQDILGTTTQVQSCSSSYDTFTPLTVSISDNDITNHAVYYVVPYNNTTTKIRVNSAVFDITYITSANANNPQVTIDGRSYPAIPYSDLTDTAVISTEEGYVSGQVCSLGDVNCDYRTIGLDISDLWTQPLRVLQSVWSSITAVFSVITEFILLIPSPLREFLISAFFLSVILGIIKIIV